MGLVRWSERFGQFRVGTPAARSHKPARLALPPPATPAEARPQASSPRLLPPVAAEVGAGRARPPSTVQTVEVDRLGGLRCLTARGPLYPCQQGSR